MNSRNNYLLDWVMKIQDFLWVCLLIGSISLCCFSCNDDKDEPEPKPVPQGFFNIEKVSYDVSAEAQTFDVRIHTNVKASPKVLGDVSSWVSVGDSQQADEYLTYQVSVKENTDSNERKGMVLFTPVPVPGIMIGSSQIGSNTIIITQASAEP